MSGFRGEEMKNSIESCVEKAVGEILEKRAFNATQLRAEKSGRYKEVESISLSLALQGNGTEEKVNALVAFWQEQAYMQGLEDSSSIQEELKKYGIHAEN